MARTKDPVLERRRRNAIMAATYKLLAQSSFHAVTLSGVADAAGVSKGMVTYYYDSKDTLFMETVATFQARYEQVFAGLLGAAGSDDEKLRMLIRAALPSQRAVADETMVQVEIWSFAKSRPQVLDWLAQRYHSFRQTCAELLANAGTGADGENPTSDQFARRYGAIHALIDGLSFQVAADRDADMAAYRALAYDGIRALLVGANSDD